MDLNWSDSEEAFRADCREWLTANVPTGLESGDTATGFAQHLEWEKLLHEARWSVVSWPEAYAGRDATLWEWLIFEEEYYAAQAPQRIDPRSPVAPVTSTCTAPLCSPRLASRRTACGAATMC